MKRWIIVAFFFLIVNTFFLVSCYRGATPAPAVQPVTSTASPAKATWEGQWANLTKAAKKESRVSIYMAMGGELRTRLAQALKDKFDLESEFVTGRGAEIAAKLVQERRAGIYLADIFIGAATNVINTLKPVAALDPLEPQIFLPEVLDSKAWWGGQLYWYSEHLAIGSIGMVQAPIVINTTMIKPEELKSYRDLLNPKLKGKIIFNDPTVPGPGNKSFINIGEVLMGWDFMRELAKHDLIVLRDQRLQMEWVAHGRYPIVIGPKSEIILEFQQAGAPIARVSPVEGAWLTGAGGYFALMNKAPHHNAAKLFLNWVLTREGQIIFSKAYGIPSLRLDVPKEGFDPATIPQPGVKYVNADDEKVIMSEPEHNKLAIQMFGSLIK